MEAVTFSGTVIRGDGEGMKLGYPTANLPPDLIATRGLERGVWYAGTEYQGAQYAGLVIVGVRGKDGKEKLEVYLLDFSGDLYGKTLTVTVLEKLRDLVPFTDIPSLKKQIEADIAAARAYFSISKDPSFSRRGRGG